jgi:hypothetical protein
MLEHPPVSEPVTHASKVKPVVKSNALLAGTSTKPWPELLTRNAPYGWAATGNASEIANKTRTRERRFMLILPS